MTKLPDGTVLPLDALLSRREFCRTTAVGGAALLTLGACGVGTPAAPRDGGKQDLRQNLFPDEDMSGGQPDMSTAEDMTEIPEDMTGEIRDLTRPPDLVNPNACPNGVTLTNMNAAAFQLDSATFVARANAFVCRDAGGLFGLSAVCTHQGCVIGEVNGGASGFRCACHGSEFALGGSVTRGPALSPLPHYPLCLDGNRNVAMNTNQTVAANKRYNF